MTSNAACFAVDNVDTFPGEELEGGPGPVEALRFEVFAKAYGLALEPKALEELIRGVLSSAEAEADYKTLRGLAILRAASFTFQAPEYASLAARLLATELTEKVEGSGIHSFCDSVKQGRKVGTINDRLFAFITQHGERLEKEIDCGRDSLFTWFGLKTLADRYLLRNPDNNVIMETPQYFFMRVACAVSDTFQQAVDMYQRMSTFELLPSSPTLFNAGTINEQLSSCFLMESPADDLVDIYKRYGDIALLSKHAGGIAMGYSRVRSEGSLIRSTNDKSHGIIPFLKVLDSSIAAVSRGGRRNGACCVYLEPWHADIEAFLELRDNTGDEARRTHNLNLANWIPDLFMWRVKEDAMWSLFDPKVVPALCDLYGSDFDQAYVEAEQAGLAHSQVKARDLYGRMMRTLAQSGNGWMCFKDTINNTCNQVGVGDDIVRQSNLCTEITEVTSPGSKAQDVMGEDAVCNLASLNLARHINESKTGVDWEKLADNVGHAIRQLDRCIDRNLYAIPETSNSNMRWRPVGLGAMGLQDVFFALHLPYDSAEAQLLSTQIAAFIYFHALRTSNELAEELGEHPAFDDTRTATGRIQPDLWGMSYEALDTLHPLLNGVMWDDLRSSITQHGLRNSLLIAVAPTSTIASIVGCSECLEPQVSNLFKRETLSGEFIQVNRFLVEDLRRLGRWTEETRQSIKSARGSVQQLDIPAPMKAVYRTAWELSMRSMLDMAAARGPFIDQSQSTNLFVESPNIGKLSSMYMYAWQKGLKTTYYLRSRPATEIESVAAKKPGALAGLKAVATEAEAVTCSMENPESCESCQ